MVLQSRSGKELGRYFPELVESLRDELAPRCVLDGEVVVPPREIDGRVRLDWESLSQRIHPAESRVAMLAEQTPAHFIGFDALATGNASLMGEPFRVRREALLELVSEKTWCHVTRTTEDPELGTQWLTTFEGAGLDGGDRQATRRTLPGGQARDGQGQAQAGRRLRRHRVPRAQERGGRRVDFAGPLPRGRRTANDRWRSVVHGQGPHQTARRVGAIARRRRTGRRPSRWNSAADKRWIPVRPEKVAEVAYDQMEGNGQSDRRFRHAVKFVRWRPDRDPSSCTFAQLDVPLNYDLSDVLEN